VFSELRVDGVLRSPEVHRGLFAWIIGTTDVVSDMGQRGRTRRRRRERDDLRRRRRRRRSMHETFEHFVLRISLGGNG
jgi:hypothetical protein